MIAETATAKVLEGRVVLVTGATSGIGATASVAFHNAGAKVFGTARNKDALAAARARSPAVSWLQADVSRAGEVKAAVDALVREAGRLDVLVNNAGIFQFATLERATEALVRAQFEVNVYGATFAAQAALPALKASRGTIINVSSVAGHKPMPGGAHYGASKAALESLTRSWALELASRPAGVVASFGTSGRPPGRCRSGRDDEGQGGAHHLRILEWPVVSPFVFVKPMRPRGPRDQV